MKNIIQLLPDAIANQIAAGEVVQRPSSVVKELLENAIDAESTHIQLIVKDAGKTLIQVIDDGTGMTSEDARMSFERHATSKIRSADDLFKIRSMGFRGEALASIAAIAHVEMKTKTQDCETGTLFRVEGSSIQSEGEVACTKGTSIAVKNLFFNTPARRNFLKSNAVEMRHIIDEFQRVAIAHPEVAFSLYHDDLEVFQLQKATISKRLVQLFGKNYSGQLIPCTEKEFEFVQINGFIGKPTASKKTRGEQFFYINKRFIKHPYLHHAMMSAFEGLLPQDHFPFYVIFMEMDPKHIDVNIHPTKTEVKFDDEKSVYAVLQSTIKKALATYHVTPAIDFGIDVNLVTESKGSPAYGDFKKSEKRSFKNTSGWEQIYEGLQQSTPSFKEQKNSLFAESKRTLSFTSDFDKIENEEIEIKKVAFQLHNQYIVTQVKSGMMIINQQAAHERILYDKFKDEIRMKKGVSQPSLFPVKVQLNPSDFTVFEEIKEELKSLGFMFEVNDKEIVVTGIPVGIRHEHEEYLLEEFIEQYVLHESLTLNTEERMARALAKKTAIRQGVTLSDTEINALIAQLFSSTNPNYTPNGEPIVEMLNIEKIEALFAQNKLKLSEL